MSDIAMCSGDGCPDRNGCYRHRATPSEFRQAWFAEPPRTEAGCDYYWPNPAPEPSEDSADE